MFDVTIKTPFLEARWMEYLHILPGPDGNGGLYVDFDYTEWEDGRYWFQKQYVGAQGKAIREIWLGRVHIILS